MSEWIDTRKNEPKADGIYLVQMAGDYVTAMNYTVEGGWNTSRDSDGVLSDEHKLSYLAVARWFDVPVPAPIPKEWHDEWLGRS